MNFCTECGNELKDNEIFCTSCGVKQTPNKQEDAIKRAEEPVAPTPPVKQSEKQPMRKRTKWLLGIAATFAVLLIGTHLFLTSYFDPMKNFQAMDDAILANDVDSFTKHIHFDDSAVLDEESYFDYIKETEWDSIKAQFIQTIEHNEENNLKLSSRIESIEGERLFNLRQESKFFLYPTYEFQAVPTELLVSTNVEGTEVTVGETTKTLEDRESVDFALIYPGIYPMKAEADTVYGLFEEETELEVTPVAAQEFVVNFDGITQTFTTDQEAAYLFVNGENTGKTFADLVEIGPIPYDTEVELHGEWENSEGEVIKTDVLTLDDYGWYGFEFMFGTTDSDSETASGDTEEVDTNDVEEIVLDFRNAYEASLNNKDFSEIESYLETGSAVYDELEEYIGDLEDNAYHYDFTANEVLDVEEVDSENFIVTTNEIFTFTNHLDEQIDYDRTKEYSLVKSSDGFKITAIDYVETNRDY